MAKKKPREIRIGEDRYIPVVLQVITRHEDGTPKELFCPPSKDHSWDLRGMERPEFIVAWCRDVTFPGLDT